MMTAKKYVRMRILSVFSVFFKLFSVTLKAIIQYVFWFLAGILFIFSGLSLAIVIRSYYFETPLLSDVISGFGLIITFLGVIMIGYGYRSIRNVLK